MAHPRTDEVVIMTATTGSIRLSRLGLVSVILLTMVAGGICIDDFVVEDAEAVRPIILAIEMEQQTRDQHGNTQVGNLVEVQTGPGQSGSAKMIAKVRIYRVARLLRTPVFIHLRFQSEYPELTGAINPTVLQFEPMVKQGYREIEINLNIQPMTHYSTGVSPPIKGEIMGTWSTEPSLGVGGWEGGNLNTYPVYVNVKPFNELLMTFNPPILQMSPGGSGRLEILINNQGNGNDRVDLSLVGAGVLARDGWVFEFDRTSIDVGPKQEARIGINITSPRKLAGLYHIDVIRISVRAESHYSKEKALIADDESLVKYIETDFYLFLYGFDILYLPMMWALIIYLVMALVLFNMGFNLITLRKRRWSLKGGKEPGFVWLYHIISKPERRELRKLEREERRKEKAEAKARRDAEKKAETKRREESLKKSAELTALPAAAKREKAASLEFKRGKDLDMDEIDLDDMDEKPKEMIPKKKTTFSAFGRREKKKDPDSDLKAALSLLDD
ncbi:MAG: choice-of-anchor T family protein [Thermoplasmatota archaeon]